MKLCRFDGLECNPGCQGGFDPSTLRPHERKALQEALDETKDPETRRRAALQRKAAELVKGMFGGKVPSASCRRYP